MSALPNPLGKEQSQAVKQPSRRVHSPLLSQYTQASQPKPSLDPTARLADHTRQEGQSHKIHQHHAVQGMHKLHKGSFYNQTDTNRPTISTHPTSPAAGHLSPIVDKLAALPPHSQALQYTPNPCAAVCALCSAVCTSTQTCIKHSQHVLAWLQYPTNTCGTSCWLPRLCFKTQNSGSQRRHSQQQVQCTAKAARAGPVPGMNEVSKGQPQSITTPEGAKHSTLKQMDLGSLSQRGTSLE